MEIIVKFLNMTICMHAMLEKYINRNMAKYQIFSPFLKLYFKMKKRNPFKFQQSEYFINLSCNFNFSVIKHILNLNKKLHKRSLKSFSPLSLSIF